MTGFEFSEFAEVFQILTPVFIFLAGLFGAIFIAEIVDYILRGIATYKMSANRGITNGWLGFIPFARDYQLGRLAGEIELGSKKIKNTGLWLLITPIIYGVLFAVTYAIMMVPYFISMFSLGSNPSPEQLMGPMTTLMISMIFFIVIMVAAQVFLYLFRYLALHKIFSFYSGGQKPVFYIILAMFVPLAESILLFRHRDRPLLGADSV